jgi:16S rRNA (adenine1518-N6/adenine1519-N6)-dimethyltransferase
MERNRDAGIAAKKSLGQNFLHAQGVIRKIVETAALAADETVLEVGPGKGALTQALLASGAHVVAVEKDNRLIPHLSEKFSTEIANKKLTLIEADIMELLVTGVPVEGQYKLVANIPYYITGELIRAFLEADKQPALAVLMVQKEVAQRIAVKDGKESVLSLSVKAYGEPRYVDTVKRTCFTPVPNVDSAILLISDISKNSFVGFSEADFFKTVKSGFAHKRKFLSRNLETVAEGEKIREAFKTLGLADDTRAETVPLATWKALASVLAKD